MFYSILSSPSKREGFLLKYGHTLNFPVQQV